ncbi:hypothetical protein K7X08_033347 [Anisodus acutangulus]|uniref:Uncharacterized protein n=1 Tax=Anisodus acutangulus TaxID=402998 RepID=A0A9Q1M2G8_9SOLA|nr:hypothetical protein K7X08_033347 [Anisodus acutangulus]
MDGETNKANDKEVQAVKEEEEVENQNNKSVDGLQVIDDSNKKVVVDKNQYKEQKENSQAVLTYGDQDHISANNIIEAAKEVSNDSGNKVEEEGNKNKGDQMQNIKVAQEVKVIIEQTTEDTNEEVKESGEARIESYPPRTERMEASEAKGSLGASRDKGVGTDNSKSMDSTEENLEENLNQYLENVAKQADIFPKSKVKRGRRGNKQAQSNVQQPTKVVSRRGASKTKP